MLYHPECCFRKFSLPNLRPLSPDRRQVRHHRLPGGAGHPSPDRGHLDPGGHGHSLRLLRQHRQPRPGQAHQRGVHRPDCQRSPPANAGSRLAARCCCQRAHGWPEIVRPLGTARYRWRVAADSAQSAWAAIRKNRPAKRKPYTGKARKAEFYKRNWAIRSEVKQQLCAICYFCEGN